MGILTWVGEKYNEAAGPENQRKPYWTRVILTTATLYYFTDCIMPSMLCYYENVRHENFASFAMKPDNRITIPFGYTSFYWDTEPSSKRAVERTGNLVYYKGEQSISVGKIEAKARILTQPRTQRRWALCRDRGPGWYHAGRERVGGARVAGRGLAGG